MAEFVEISSGALSATIDPLGAELRSLRDGEGRELMTDADPAFWTGHAPLLFPIVGRLNGDTYRHDGQSYRLEQHGFARRSRFELVAQAIDVATFRLTDSAATRVAYPFDFVLDMTFSIAGATLNMAAMVRNPGAAPLPFSFGYHPALAWPLPYGYPRADHRIIFDADEPEALPLITPDGLIAHETRASPLAGRTLSLADDLFARNALVWRALRSHRLRYGAGDGPQLEIAFPAAPMLGIWTKPGAAFICVEPWHGIADPEGFAGAFAEKPGILTLAPGEARSFPMSVTLTQ